MKLTELIGAMSDSEYAAYKVGRDRDQRIKHMYVARMMQSHNAEVVRLSVLYARQANHVMLRSLDELRRCRMSVPPKALDVRTIPLHWVPNAGGTDNWRNA